MPDSVPVDGAPPAPSPLPVPDPPGMPAPIPVEPWRELFPGLIAGTTTRGDDPQAPFDLRLFGEAGNGPVLARWEALRLRTGMRTVVHSRQVHGTTVRLHRDPGPGLHIALPGDGHLTRDPGLLLTVALADCVPVFLAAPDAGVIALVHAGWRGSAAGILERAVGAFGERFGIEPDHVYLHLGPSIGADEYEVSPEVFRALGLREPGGPALLDLRAALSERAERAGVDPGRITRSRVGTLGDSRLFSHRGGDSGRHVAFLGIREPGSDGLSPPLHLDQDASS